jgi:hypothetical protein
VFPFTERRLERVQFGSRCTDLLSMLSPSELPCLGKPGPLLSSFMSASQWRIFGKALHVTLFEFPSEFYSVPTLTSRLSYTHGQYTSFFFRIGPNRLLSSGGKRAVPGQDYGWTA